MAAPIDRSPRRGVLSFDALPGTRFLQFLAAHGRSPETEGRIGSQYDEELSRGDAHVEAVGMFACGELVGAYSTGRVALAREPECFSGRLDAVVSHRALRGQGVGLILMAEFVLRHARDLGERLTHLSTVAVHPAVVKAVRGLGFEPPPPNSETPLYHVSLVGAARAHVLDAAERLQRRRMNETRRLCVDCQHRRWVTPWCTPARDAARDAG